MTKASGKFYGYIRVSTEHQANEGVSLAEQESRLRGYAQSLGMKVAEIFIEAGVSGGKPLAKRPKGSQLLSRVKDGDHIAVAKLDRFSRSSADALNTIEDLTKRNITLSCLDMGGAVNTNGVGKLVFSILCAVAEMERTRIAERVSDAKAHLRKGQYFLGGKLAAGHSVKNGKLVADPLWKKAVAAMTKWRADNKTYRQIADLVKEEYAISMDSSTAFRILNHRRKMDATA